MTNLVRMPKIVYNVEGAISRAECQWLLDVPAKLGSGTYVNLGVFCGRSVILLAAGLSDNGLTGKVVAVDTFDSRTMTNISGHLTLDYFKEKLDERDLGGFVEIEVGLTSEVWKKYKDSVVSFVFIDADHSYVAVKEDFELWSPLIKQDGLLAFHDSDTVGVKPLLLELTGWEKQGQVDSLSYWKRVPTR